MAEGSEGLSLGEAIEQIKADLGLDDDLRGKAAVEAAQEDLGLEDGGESPAAGAVPRCAARSTRTTAHCSISPARYASSGWGRGCGLLVTRRGC